MATAGSGRHSGSKMSWVALAGRVAGRTDAGVERRVIIGHVVAVEVVRQAVWPPGRRSGQVLEVVGEPLVGEPVLAVGQVAQGVEDDRVAVVGGSDPVGAGWAERSLIALPAHLVAEFSPVGLKVTGTEPARWYDDGRLTLFTVGTIVDCRSGATSRTRR